MDKKDLDRLDDALVHEEEEKEPMPEGWGIYATPQFLSRAVIGIYGLMLATMAVIHVVLPEAERIVLFSPTPVLAVLPVALAALYLALVSPSEAELASKRTFLGRSLTIIAVYLLMQVLTVLIWLAISWSFTLK